MGKGTLKYGGLSGVLPKVRPVFKRNPIRPPTDSEKAHAASIEQGYAKGVPLPTHRGKPMSTRVPVPRNVITVNERIARTIDRRESEEQDSRDSWRSERNALRREYLRLVYLKEEKRLQLLDEKTAEAERKKKLADNERLYVELDASRLTLPTIDSYLDGPIMRKRTPEEKAQLQAQRKINRKKMEEALETRRANSLLELYHAAQNFITNETELESAIEEAFEINFSKHDSIRYTVEDRIKMGLAPGSKEATEQLVMDHVRGEINGRPGVDVVSSTLSGELERLRREATVRVNDGL